MLVGSLAALALAVLAATDRIRMRLGAAGLVLVALGALSLLVGAGTLDAERLSRVAMTAAVPPWFLETSLSFVGLGLLIAAAGTRSWLGAAAAVAVGVSLGPLLGGISLPRVGGVLLLLGAGIGGMALVAGGLRGRLSRAGTPLPRQEPATINLAAWAAFAAGLIAVASPWAWLTLGASVVAFTSVLGLPLRRPQRIVAGLSGLLVLGSLVALAAVAAPPADPGAPGAGYLGATRSLVIGGLLLLPSAVGLGIWPCPPLTPGWVLAPAAFALAGRFAPETVPLGLAWWLPAVFPVAIVGMVRGLLQGQGAAALGSIAWLGLWIGTPESRLGAGILVAISVVVPLAARVRAAEWSSLVSRILWAGGGMGAVLVLWGGLTVEVVYSVLLAMLAAATLLSTRGVAAPEGPP